MTLFLYLCFLILLRNAIACNEDDVRLYNGSSTVKGDGMLQICYGGDWVAVCDYIWTRDHSIVACKALGYNNPNPIAYPDSGYWHTLGFAGNYYCNQSSSNILDCLSNSSYYLNSYYHRYYCNNNQDTISLQCYFNTSRCTYKQLRLYNRTSNNEGDSGMLQICDSTGHWTAVCDYGWDCQNSRIACNDLGYNYNDTKPSFSLNGGPWTKIGFGPYNCYSYSSSLFGCYNYSSNTQHSPYICNPLRDTVKLVCSKLEPDTGLPCSIEYDVRLVNRTSISTSEGRIEICYNQKWTTICQSKNYYYYYYYSSSERLAATLCNQLGLTATPFAKIITDGRYGVGSSDLYIFLPHCYQAYNNISDCYIYGDDYSECGDYECQHNQVGLKCYEPGGCNTGDVRLVNGFVTREGRLEVCVSGVWGRVCSQQFSRSAARIACIQANFTDVEGAVIDSYGKYGIGDNPIVFNDVDCFGHEKTLLECSKTVFPKFYCPDDSIVGLLCLDSCKEGDVRLVGGAHKFQGTVEICLDHSWCLVAQDDWDNLDAIVVCRELGGYNNSAGEAIFNSTYGKPKRSIRYTNVNCYGNEKRLADCAHHTLEFDSGSRYNTEVAGVDCHVIISTLLPTSTSQPQSNIGSAKVVFISGIVLVAVGFSTLGIGIVLTICSIVRIQQFKKRSNNVQQMSSLQKNDPLSIQCELADVSKEDGESPSSDDEDQDEDDKLLKI